MIDDMGDLPQTRYRPRLLHKHLPYLPSITENHEGEPPVPDELVDKKIEDPTSEGDVGGDCPTSGNDSLFTPTD